MIIRDLGDLFDCLIWGRPPKRTCFNNDVNKVHTFGKGVPEINVVEGDYYAIAPGPFEGLFALHSLFFAHLILVVFGKVVDYDGNRQCNDQYAANRTHRAEYFAHNGFGCDVTVAHRSHGDDCPPESLGDGAEGSALLVLLGKVHETGEDEDAHGQEEHEEAEFLVAVLEGVTQTLETCRVSGQLEDPENPHDPKHLHDASDILEAGVALVGLK